MNQYYHFNQMPEVLVNYLIDLKCEIDMGDHSPEKIVDMKREFNKRTASCCSIKPYSL